MAEERNNKRPIPVALLVAVAVAVLIVLVLLGRFCSTAATINVTVNGSQLTLHGAKTMETAIRESGLPINPGDLISLGGTTLKKSVGYPFSATVNNQETTDPAFQLHEGDVITVNDGADKIEEYDAVEETLPHGGDVLGLGAFCSITPGVDGVREVRTGKISGDVVKKTKTAATDASATWYNPNVNGEKVIALTFDDGPSEKYTASILDVLRENDAKATFFCTGSKALNSKSLVQRERDDGHQVCSGTYSLSWSAILSGKDDGASIDSARVADEVQRGRQAISEVLGEEASRCVRIPVPELTGSMVAAIDSQANVDVSWNVDTGDWVEYNTEQIYRALMNCEPGDVVLLHDGGGDRTATAQALGRALPKLKADGYSFITIDELLAYPAQ